MFFIRNGFVRKRCASCGENFWTQDVDREICGDAPCQEYTFIGSPPTSRKYTLPEMREAFLSFFERHGHARIKPYPVVARWRDDLYVTIASIAAFQPHVTEGIVPPPANPLVISQPCLRFTDIDNVGLTGGRHLSIFEMGGHHAFNYPDKQVYWKDETVRLHHEFVTRTLGVESEHVTYKEGFWSGGGNAGPCLEGCIDGLESSTLVFMQYKVIDGQLAEMPMKVVDTGYGIERFMWVSQGAPSGFHAIYGLLLDEVMRIAGLKGVDDNLLVETTKRSALMALETMSDRMTMRRIVAQKLGMDRGELEKVMAPIESVYAVLDHTKALTFMLAEGVVPSNVKAGYLTRLLIRRAYRLLRALGIEERMSEIVKMQVDYWSPDFPNLREMEGEILEALSVEEGKYRNTLEKGKELVRKVAGDLKAQGEEVMPVEALVEMYDSHGVPPEVVKEAAEDEGVDVLVPDNFYATVAERHISPPKATEVTPLKRLEEQTQGLPETRTLFYEDSYLQNFNARVLRVIENKYVVLDRTAFYAEGGGEPSDRGVVLSPDGMITKVVDVQKVGNILVHVLEGQPPSEGAEVSGVIDWDRRINLMRHHTATHIVLGAARRVLGQHAWQAGAEKGVDRSRLDISHWERITTSQLSEIERLANQVVTSNLTVQATWMPRDEAERTYGFRLYQGGVVPEPQIRVVKVGDWDVEACGGTHCHSTGEVGLIKILHTERIQDGVERLIFSAGSPAIEYVQGMERSIIEVGEALNTSADRVVEAVKSIVEEWKNYRREVERLRSYQAEHEAEMMLSSAPTVDRIRLITHTTRGGEVDHLIKIGSSVTKTERGAVFVGCDTDDRVRIVAMAGEDAVSMGVDAGKIASEVSKVLGGGGGGRPSFGQGGGVDAGKISSALKLVEMIVRKQVAKGGS